MSRDLAANAFDRALLLCDLGRLDDAEAALREALIDEPADPFAHGMLALVLVDLDRGEEALESASSAIALAPDLPLGHTARARALLLLERFKQSEAAAREAIRLDPENAETRVVLAATLAGRGRWADALSAAEQALALNPDSETARGFRAWALAMSQDGGDWQGAADETLSVAPDSSDAHALAGYAHLRRGGEREAADRFREALRLDPESEAAQAGLAEAMKASHPLFKPLFRFFVWQERLSTGAKVAITVGPLIALRALRPAADNPFVLALIFVWIAFVALTWLSVPLANLALRFSQTGRHVLPADQKRSSTAFLACLGVAVAAVVLVVAVSPGFFGTALTAGLLAFSVGSVHSVALRLRRIVYLSAAAAGLASVVGGTLIAAGFETVGAVLQLLAMLSALALIWVVRLG